MSSHDFDLFVIGGGSGGVRAARIAAGHGARVGLAESYRMGGTCVIRGCVPKKLLAYASRFSDAFDDAAGFGWTLGGAEFSWSRLIANKDKEIARLEAAYEQLLASAHVEMFRSHVRFLGPNLVQLDDGREISAAVILVATGGAPFLPLDIPGQEHGFTSNEAFHLAELPARIAIFGGGFISVEFAGIFNGLGANVTQIYRGPALLRGFDMDLRRLLMEEMTARGISIRVNTGVGAIEKEGEHYHVRLTDGSSVTVDAVMFALGRRPNVAGLGLDLAGVATGPDGEILVNEYSQSNVPSIYAVGDVTNRFLLTPIAIAEGHAFADSVFGNRPRKIDYRHVPIAVFSTPNIGTVGLTEEEAVDRGHDVDIYLARFRPMIHTLSGRNERALMKLVVDSKSDVVLGCHLIGEGAPELIQCLAIAVRMGARKADFDATIPVHPTAAEELVTLRSKTRSVKGKSALS